MKRSLVAVTGAVALLAWGVVPTSSAVEPADDLTIAEGIALADDLSATVSDWAGDAAPQVVDVVPYDGKVVVLTEGDEQDVQAAVPDAVSANVEVVQGGIEYVDSPAASDNGWVGGNWIGSTTANCTAGFNFRVPSTGAIVGSTARHCGAGPWSNNGRLVGSASRAGTGDNDVELLSGTGYGSEVWTRGPIRRSVASTGTNVVGESIEHYGRTSGGGTGVITRVDASGRVYSTDTGVRKGDSGGPVYTIAADGRVEALGTVSALTYRDDNKNGVYDPTDTVIGMVHTDIGVTAADLGVVVATDQWVQPLQNGSFSFVGHGNGTGRGLSQWGAHEAAVAGQSASQILATYYPGTVASTQQNIPIRVLLSTGRAQEVSVDATAGLVLVWRDGVLALPAVGTGGTAILNWRLRPQGADLALDYVESGKATWKQYSFVPGTEATFRSPSGTVFLDRPNYQRLQYRGEIGARRSGATWSTINVVPLEDYLRGVLPTEMSSSWPKAALQAQAVVARTSASYARYMAGANGTHICDTATCQPYRGMALYGIGLSGTLVEAYETAEANEAISATANSVLLTGAGPYYAQTPYTTSNGGLSAAGGVSYLVARKDPYDDASPSPDRTWRSTVKGTTVAAAYPGVGQPLRVIVLTRDGSGEWGGRVTSVRVEGSAGTVIAKADDFAAAVGLRSSWWTSSPTPQPAGGFALDVTGDGIPDLYGRDAETGELLFYRGQSNGTFAEPVGVGTGWGMHDMILLVPDVTGDGIPDLYAREAATGYLWLYTLNRSGAATSRRVVGTGWDTVDLVVSPGDVTGNGIPDLWARNKLTCSLQFYSGAPGGGFSSVKVVNSGWCSVDALTSVGDISGDGVPDILARQRSTGSLLLYTGTRSGTLSSVRTIDGGWSMFDLIIGGRSSSGAFLLGRLPVADEGRMLRYSLTAPGVVHSGAIVGTGWDGDGPTF